jgi:hypothetical protein
MAGIGLDNTYVSKECADINEIQMLSAGLFPGICSLIANISEHSCLFCLHRQVGMKCDFLNCSHTSYVPAYGDGMDSVFRNVGI